MAFLLQGFKTVLCRHARTVHTGERGKGRGPDEICRTAAMIAFRSLVSARLPV